MLSAMKAILKIGIGSVVEVDIYLLTIDEIISPDCMFGIDRNTGKTVEFALSEVLAVKHSPKQEACQTAERIFAL
jgi:hypothetical protein